MILFWRLSEISNKRVAVLCQCFRKPQRVQRIPMCQCLGTSSAILPFDDGQKDLQLDLVQVIFRHGDRAPLAKERYPNDPYNVSMYEPWGLGQLTNKGKMREYKIGAVLRTRYDEFLGKIYHPTDVYAVCTDLDRTKMSLQLALAGLYPPAEIQTWHPNIPWLAIPIHYAPEHADVTLRPHFCQSVQNGFDEAYKSPEMQKKLEKYRDLFQLLTEKTGMNVSTPLAVYELCHLFIAQKALDLNRPAWVTDEIYRRMEELTVVQYEIYSYTTDLKRTNGGTLLRKFLENIKNKDEQNSPRKMYLYAAHETNVAAYMRTISVEEYMPIPEFGSAVIMEKLHDSNGKKFIRHLLWTGVTEKLIPLKLKDCPEVCPFEQYMKAVKNVIPTDKEMNCLWEQMTPERLKELFNERINFN